MFEASKLFNLELISGVIEKDSIKNEYYNKTTMINNGFINEAKQGETSCLLMCPNVCVNEDGFLSHLIRQDELSYSMLVPIQTDVDLYGDKEKISYNLKGSLSVKRNDVELFSLLQRIITQMEEQLSYFESANNIFNTDSTGQTPMLPIATETAPKVATWKQEIDNIKKEMKSFIN
jgi:hypothetical protein